MKFTRRNFIKFGFICASGIYFPLPKFAQASSLGASRNSLPILQGATDETRTQFSIVHPVNQGIFVFAETQEGRRINPAHIQLHRHKDQLSSVTQVFFTDLPKNEDIQLLVTNPKKQVLDQRIFRTLSEKEDLKFAICSCMDERYHDARIWNELFAQKPDIIFFIGDSVYADSEAHNLTEAKPATLWRRFTESRSVLEIYHQKRLIPVLAVWDDHDFGENDSNSQDYPYVIESQKNFLTFFPQDPNYCGYLERGPGISCSVTFGRHQILLLDDRSFRLPSGSENRYAHWGRDQEEWIINKIKNHPDSTWLMNGSQFFPNVIWKESVSRNHPVQLEGFVGRLSKLEQKVIFASGDVHYSEISQIEAEQLGYETFEVTSSSVHSPSVPGFPGLVPNPRRIESTGDRNYVLVKSKRIDGKLAYKVESRSMEKRVNFSRVLSV